MSKPTDWEIETGYDGMIAISRGRGPSYEKMRITEAERRINAHDGLVEALKMAQDCVGYVTSGDKVHRTIKAIEKALAAVRVKDETTE